MQKTNKTLIWIPKKRAQYKSNQDQPTGKGTLIYLQRSLEKINADIEEALNPGKKQLEIKTRFSFWPPFFLSILRPIW